MWQNIPHISARLVVLSTPKPKAFNIKTKCIYKNFLLYYRTEGSFCIFKDVAITS